MEVGMDREMILQTQFVYWLQAHPEALGSGESLRSPWLSFSDKEAPIELGLGGLTWFLNFPSSSGCGLSRTQIASDDERRSNDLFPLNCDIRVLGPDNVYAVELFTEDVNNPESEQSEVREFLENLLLPDEDTGYLIDPVQRDIASTSSSSHLKLARVRISERCTEGEILDHALQNLGPCVVRLRENLHFRGDLAKVLDLMNAFGRQFCEYRQMLLDAGDIKILEYEHPLMSARGTWRQLDWIEGEVWRASLACHTARDATGEVVRALASIMADCLNTTSGEESLDSCRPTCTPPPPDVSCDTRRGKRHIEFGTRAIERMKPKFLKQEGRRSRKAAERMMAKTLKKEGKESRILPTGVLEELQEIQACKLPEYEALKATGEMSGRLGTCLSQQVLNGDVLQWCNLQFDKGPPMSVQCELEVGHIIKDELSAAAMGISVALPLHIEMNFVTDYCTNSTWNGNIVTNIFASQKRVWPRTEQSEFGLSRLVPHLVRRYIDQTRIRTSCSDWDPSFQRLDENFFIGLLQFLARSLAFLPHLCPICGVCHSHPASSLPHPCEKNLCQAQFSLWKAVGPALDPSMKDFITISPDPTPNQWDFEVMRYEVELKAKHPYGLDPETLMQLQKVLRDLKVQGGEEMDYEQLIHAVAVVKSSRHWKGMKTEEKDLTWLLEKEDNWSPELQLTKPGDYLGFTKI